VMRDHRLHELPVADRGLLAREDSEHLYSQASNAEPLIVAMVFGSWWVTVGKSEESTNGSGHSSGKYA
jgi:hypothetical protein